MQHGDLTYAVLIAMNTWIACLQTITKRENIATPGRGVGYAGWGLFRLSAWVKRPRSNPDGRARPWLCGCTAAAGDKTWNVFSWDGMGVGVEDGGMGGWGRGREGPRML